jgi:hypothetical protein
MSLVAIRAALEVGLNGMSPALATAYENVAFTPPAKDTAYQRVVMLPAQPENPAVGAQHRREVGVMQVSLHYPFNAGTQAVMFRAEMIQARFRRGSTWTKDGVAVIVDLTPAIAPGRIQDDRFVIDVSVPYYADIFTT